MGIQSCPVIERTSSSSSRRRPPPRTTTNSKTNAHEMVGKGGISSRYRPPRNTSHRPYAPSAVVPVTSELPPATPTRTKPVQESSDFHKMGNQLSLRTGRTSSIRRQPPPRTTSNSNTNAHEKDRNSGSSRRHRPPRTTLNPDFNADLIDRGSSSRGRRPPSRTTSDPNSNTDDADLNSYKAASRDDPDLRSLDCTFDQGLFDLVNDYSENRVSTRDFCTALDSRLKKSGIVESIINIPLKKFEEHYGEYNGEGSVKNLLQTKEKQDKKLKELKARKKVSKVIFLSTSVLVSICTVVAAAVSFSPLAAAAAVVVLMEKWVNSIWKKREKDLMGQRKIISSKQIASRIKVLVEKFQIKIKSLLGNAECAVRVDDEAVVKAMKEIKKEVNGFIKTIQD